MCGMHGLLVLTTKCFTRPEGFDFNEGLMDGGSDHSAVLRSRFTRRLKRKDIADNIKAEVASGREGRQRVFQLWMQLGQCMESTCQVSCVHSFHPCLLLHLVLASNLSWLHHVDRAVSSYLVTVSRKQTQERENAYQWMTLTQLQGEYGEAPGLETFNYLRDAGAWRQHPSAPGIRSMEQVNVLRTTSATARDQQSMEASGTTATEGDVLGLMSAPLDDLTMDALGASAPPAGRPEPEATPKPPKEKKNKATVTPTGVVTNEKKCTSWRKQVASLMRDAAETSMLLEENKLATPMREEISLHLASFKLVYNSVVSLTREAKHDEAGVISFFLTSIYTVFSSN
jgi:hypothetical protein